MHSSSVGTPPPFFEVRILDDQGRDLPPGEVGEIAGRGPIKMLGYYKQPDLMINGARLPWLPLS